MRLPLFVASFTLLSAAHALDLTPHYAEVDADGLRVRLPYFQDGSKRVFIAPPDGWKIVGDSAGAVLRSEAAARSSVVFALSPKPLLTTTEDGRKATREAVLALAPKGSEAVRLDTETPDPLTLNGWKTHELRISYDLPDARYVKTVLLVRLNAREELQVVATGPESEFPRAAAAAMTCLRTWHKK